MATAKQRKAVERIVENHGVVSTAMLDAGYTPASAKNPKNLTESKGYAELLDEYGLTQELIVTSLVSDIRNKPKRRLPELALAAKMRNMVVDRTDLTTNGKDLPVPILGGQTQKDGDAED